MVALPTYSFRVYYEDTDAGGIVYFANYLKFGERARTELLHYMGFSHSKMLKDQGVMFIVRSCLLNCLAPGRLDDVLEVRTHFKKPGHVKLEVTQEIVREDQVLATLEVVLACVNTVGKPVKIDERFRQTLLDLES